MRDYLFAVPTVGTKGLDDVISRIFARSPTFTFIDVSNGEVNDVEVEVNEEAQLKQGSGPIVAKKLKDRGVNVVVIGELGPGVKTVLEMNEIKIIHVEPGSKVGEALDIALEEMEKSES
ncbi:MAG: NifB/NifX family molybdenum-iron cluster-binding protein [Candidatus Bathyarchaeia archaeon]